MRLPEHLRPIQALWIAVIVTWLAVIGYVGWAHGQLPDKVAVHFGTSGEPNRWSSSVELSLIISLIVTLEFATFAAIAWFLPRVSHQLWNLPNKSYWLAPDRAEITATLVCRDLLAMALATLALLGVVHWDVVQANVSRPNQELAITLWAVGVYMAVLFGIIIAMLVRLNRVPSDQVAELRAD